MAKKVVIDAGHGGDDPGTIANGIVEKNYTLLISKYIKNRLDQLGIDASLTREIDESLTPSNRPKRIQSFYGKGDDVIVLSNHINAGGANGCYCKLISFFTISTIWITNSIIRVFKYISF